MPGTDISTSRLTNAALYASQRKATAAFFSMGSSSPNSAKRPTRSTTASACPRDAVASSRSADEKPGRPGGSSPSFASDCLLWIAFVSYLTTRPRRQSWMAILSVRAASSSLAGEVLLNIDARWSSQSWASSMPLTTGRTLRRPCRSALADERRFPGSVLGPPRLGRSVDFPCPSVVPLPSLSDVVSGVEPPAEPVISWSVLLIGCP